jgi:hypothetical protein
MPNIYIRTGPFDDEPQPQGSSGDASDPWAAFPDATPQAPAYASDPWAAFPDWPPAQAEFGDINPFASLPGNTPWSVNEIPPMGALYSAPKSFGSSAPLQTNSDPWAAFPDAPPQAPTYASDPWTAFPDRPPAQAQVGDADLLAAYPDLHARFFALQAPGNARWSVNELPPASAFYSAPRSFGDFASQPAGDPWAMFPDWSSTQAQPTLGVATPNISDEVAQKRSLVDKILGLTGERYQFFPERTARDFIGLPQRLTEAMTAAPVGTREWIENVIGPATDLAMLGLPLKSAVLTPGALPAAEQSIWKLGWAARGIAAEERVRGRRLPPGFRSIDKFPNGNAISVKSIDLNAVTYQNAQALSRVLNNYVDKLATWRGQPKSYGGVTIQRRQIKGRTLRVIVPTGAMNATQESVFNAVAARAKSRRIKLIVTPVP